MRNTKMSLGKSSAFAFAFAFVLTCVWLFALPAASKSLDAAIWNTYWVVNYGGGHVAGALQALIGPHLGVGVGGVLDPTTYGRRRYFLVQYGTWGAENMTTFLGTTVFVSAFVQGFVYAAIVSWVLRRGRPRTGNQEVHPSTD